MNPTLEESIELLKDSLNDFVLVFAKENRIYKIIDWLSIKLKNIQ